MRWFTSVLAVLPAIWAAPTPAVEDTRIANQWIVKVKNNANLDAVLETAQSILSLAQVVEPTHKYDIGGAFKGFSISGSEAFLNTLLSLDAIESFEPDHVVSIAQYPNAPWNIKRVSSRTPRPAAYYTVPLQTGVNVNVYILDTGIFPQHSEFNYDPNHGSSRASQGPNFSSDPDAADRHGHGTHVAATAVGATHGVAIQANVIGVKVLNSAGSGELSQVIAGIDWVVRNSCANGCDLYPRAVINMSLRFPQVSQALNDASNAAMASNVVVVAAAGNDRRDASTVSPASASGIITVGAVDINDRRADFSNFGSTVDIFAPGVGIESASIAGPNAFVTYDGTSMAAPHVAGLAACLRDGRVSAAAVADKIRELATVGVVSNLRGEANRMIFNGNTFQG